MDQELKEQFSESYTNLVDKLEGWINVLITNLPNLIIAIIVFVVSYYLSNFIQSRLSRILKSRIKEASVRSLIATSASVLVILAGLVLAIGVLNLSTVLKSMLAGAGVAGLAIGLALQSSLSNTFSGVYLSLKDILNVGDWIETNGFAGTVHEVNLRNTVIKEPDNNLVMIPNKMVVENPFKNYGLTRQIKVIVKCGVGYESNLQEVEEIAIKAIKDNFEMDDDKPIEFHWLEFGDSSINFQLRFFIDASVKTSILESRSKAIKVIKKTFDEKEINIPFPIRTVFMHQEQSEA